MKLKKEICRKCLGLYCSMDFDDRWNNNELWCLVYEGGVWYDIRQGIPPDCYYALEQTILSQGEKM